MLSQPITPRAHCVSRTWLALAGRKTAGCGWFWGVWKDEWSDGGRGAGDEVKVVAMGKGQGIRGFDPNKDTKGI